MKPRILVITPVRHIPGVIETLERAGEVNYLDDPTPGEVREAIVGQHAVFTNPNKSDVFLGEDVLAPGLDLVVLCTASTGTNHIDLAHTRQRGITVLCLKEESKVIDRISSTAEHAFALMLSALRHIPAAFEAVRRGDWDYEPFIGRQLDHLTVGVVGYGRLGRKFAHYVSAFGTTVLVFDPYVEQVQFPARKVELDQLLRSSDVISLHVHLDEETTGMVDRSWFARMKSSVLLVNTARGELVHEWELIDFLRRNPGAQLVADVVAGEVLERSTSPLIEYARKSTNAILTPHIGGMTREGQAIAFNHAAEMLERFILAEWTCGQRV